MAWSRRRLAAWWLAALFTLLLLALAFPTVWLRPLIQQVVQERSGRRVDFQALRLGLDGAGALVVTLRKLQVENARWAAPVPLVRAGEVGFTLPWSGLWSDEWIVSRLLLVDAEVDLERQADGLRNWRLTRPNDRGPGRVRVLSVDARQTRARILHAGLGLDARVQVSPLPAGTAAGGRPGLSLSKAFELHGQRGGVSFEAQGAVSDVLTLSDTGQSFALRVQLETAASKLEIDGIAHDVLGRAGFDAQARYSARPQTGRGELATVVNLRGRSFPSLAAELHGRMQKQGRRWTVLRAAGAYRRQRRRRHHQLRRGRRRRARPQQGPQDTAGLVAQPPAGPA